MNKDYLTAYRACSNDEERSYVNNRWWNTSHEIIIRSMMHQNDIPNLVRNSRLIWRKNVRHFFEMLEHSRIPLVIFSAGVTDIIDEAIRQLLGYRPDNITTAANVMSFDQSGFVSGFTDPPLHSLCKNVARLEELVPDATKKFAQRSNVVVIGDTDSDARMVDDWQEKRMLKIGLEAQEQRPLKLYDVVIKDPDCSRLTAIVQFMLST
ncbi:HAD hydrolase, family IE [Oesophagostomum dentatum]|uniref:5'-nucleotidase n=1 Tax=Oesophagostomum dentatum TaxID=61180 RepID=A0A0B1TNG1_OESDE|nr:HAD hydrolase, family IE [Oesophagostomum dentatum]